MSKTNLIVIILSFIISASAVLSYTIYRIKVVSSEDITEYKEEKNKEIEQNLKSYIDIAYSTIEFYHQNSSMNQEYLEKTYGQHLKNVIDVTYTMLRSKAELVKDGKLTLDDAQAIAAAEIKQIRYDDGNDYVFIIDTTLPYPNMIMHPIKPSLDGKVLNNPKYNTALDKEQNMFVAFVEVTKITETNQNGDGFVNYKVSKPTQDGVSPDVPNTPKLSYVKLFPEWNWIIGTGIYIDDAIQDSLTNITDIIRTMRYETKYNKMKIKDVQKQGFFDYLFLLIKNLFTDKSNDDEETKDDDDETKDDDDETKDRKGYFWIVDISNELDPKYIMHPYEQGRENESLTGDFSNLKTRVDSFIDKCKNEKDNAGYVEYTGEKPMGVGYGGNKKADKKTYVKLYEPLNWIIGTGFYMDSIEKAVKEKEKILNQRINTLITKISIATLSIVLLIGTLSYLINHYFIKNKTVVLDEAGREKTPSLKKSNQEVKKVSNEALSHILKSHVSISMGVALIPIPIVDFISVTAIQVSMLSEIAEKFGVPFSKEKVTSLLFSLMGGAVPVVASTQVASMIKFIPVIGQVSGLITMPIMSGASTYAVGKLFILHFAAGGTFSNFDPQNAKEDYAKMSKEGMEFASTLRSDSSAKSPKSQKRLYIREC